MLRGHHHKLWSYAHALQKPKDRTIKGMGNIRCDTHRYSNISVWRCLICQWLYFYLEKLEQNLNFELHYWQFSMDVGLLSPNRIASPTLEHDVCLHLYQTLEPTTRIFRHVSLMSWFLLFKSPVSQWDGILRTIKMQYVIHLVSASLNWKWIYGKQIKIGKMEYM